MTTTLIRGGRLIDPSREIDEVGDLLLVDGRIAVIDDDAATAETTVEAEGLIVCPGLVDSQTALREPGFEEDETIATGTAAALAGGVTSLACLPDTVPVVDNRAAAEFIQRQAERAGNCHVFPLGAVTKDHAGEELAEIGQLVEGGAVAFTDGKRPVANAEIMRRALEYTRMFDRRIFNHPQVPELVVRGVMHEGFYSTLLGLRGMPAAAEEIMVARDVALAKLTSGRVHLMTLSAAGSVECVRQAKRRGIDVTASVTPHQLVLTDAELQMFDAHCKVDPPLRSSEHVEALIEGLCDGTIDVICSDHQPHAAEKKDRELDLAPFGIVGLETLLPLCVRALVEPGHLDWPGLISRLTIGPARLLGLSKGTLEPGADADVVLIDPDAEWTIDPAAFRSRSRNPPFAGWRVTGRVVATYVSGERRYELT